MPAVHLWRVMASFPFPWGSTFCSPELGLREQSHFYLVSNYSPEIC